MNLYNHQKVIVDEDKHKTGLFLGTGAGKTRIALLLARGKTLVIAPKTQASDGNWPRECEKLSLKLDLTVISKETFRRDHSKLPKFDTVIAEEAHTLLGVTPNIRWRNKKPIPKASQLFEALESFLNRTQPKRFYLCTATIVRSPMTVWGAAKLLGHNWDFYEYRNTFYTHLPIPGREVWVPKTDSATKDRLAALVRKLGYTGRLEDYFDVPPQTFKTDYIPLTVAQTKRIKEMVLEYPEPIVRVGKIHQIENGVLAGDEFSKAESFPNGKIERILDYASEFPKMIIFAKFTAQIAQISAALTTAGYRVFVMTGATKDRGALLAEAKKTDKYIFICQAQVSAGWELPNCPVVVFASRTYSFVDYDQALGRVQRSDNIKKNLYINLVVKGGTDEAVDDCLREKKDFNERIYVQRG